jgi:putative flippase GtrA
VGDVTAATQGRTRGRYWHLLSRFALASAVATAISQLLFFVSYTAGASAAVATVIAWAAGAVPNFVLNQRTWGGGGRAALRGEILRYAAISIGTALLAAVATSNTETLAKNLFAHTRPAQVMAVWGAFAGTYAVMFFVKFYLVDRIVFTSNRQV